ncbi:MAG: bifunctional (p)ppGpp synthetase/guanosine-3',5'-bis(diphosphate) 3'-pyrophosphohydrolase [Bacteroidales bacterium]|nr:bifunctional (p)ppGpp synthetase/guanosine-3',5'-bis(diphosphate) 3'-pyrophosphohydrolase [Bacteroidales bacterium]
MANKAMDTTLLDRAIQFAVKAHGGTERRGKGFPYVVHPLEAVAIAATISPDQEILAAAALHDVLEDTCVTAEELEKEFGHRVTQLVMEETDKFFAGISEAQSWTERKKIAMERLKNASRDAKIVAMGDKLSNARAIWRDYKEKGDELWKIFHVHDKALHKWHYEGLADALSELSDSFAYKEFEFLIHDIFD